MDIIVRQAAIEELGEEEGKKIEIIDGVIAGILEFHTSA
jgi:hypothetical protein